MPRHNKTQTLMPTSAPAPSPSPAQSALSEGILNSRNTTKLDIVRSAKEVFGANLPISHSKGRLVFTYKNLIVARGIPVTPGAPTEAQPTTQPNSQRRVTTKWNVRRQLRTGAIDFIKPFNGDTYSLIKAIETCICQHLGEATPEITILAGRWWSPLSSNFTITFAGRPTIATILKYKEALLCPFGPNIFEITPEEGQSRLVFQGVPIIRNPDGSLPMSKQLCEKLGHNLPYRACTPIEGPVWTKATLANLLAKIGAFTFLLSDPGQKLSDIICKPSFMFGAQINVGFASQFTTLHQCAKCHILSHSMERCT
jgi:hypothetical protein